jgi:acyl dehydratase
MPVFLEDIAVGDERELGSYSVSREEIIEFATKYDPQPFHLDEEAARAYPFGGLIASGWHTAAIAMRIMVFGFVQKTASLGSPGADEIRWLTPVRPGDTLTLSARVIEVRPSKSKPDRGSVKLAYTMKNQQGQTVMTMIGIGIIGRRPGSETSSKETAKETR